MRVSRGLAAALGFSLAWSVAAAPPRAAQVDAATVERWMEELSNWGRWGKDDEKGTLNLITAETRRAAARLVRDGVSVSLAHDEIEERAKWNPFPFQHLLIRGPSAGNPSSADSFSVIFHGATHTHLDALCHFSYREHLYNGVPSNTIAPPEGCERNAVTALRDGVLTRGVLVDVAALDGARWLDPGRAIRPADLEAWEAKAGVKIGPGDALLVRTGRWARWAEKGPWLLGQSSAGLDASCAPWLRERGVAILGTDVGADVRPTGIEGYPNPIHVLALVAMGMPLLDALDLEAVAAEAQQRGRWEFLFTMAPLRVVGGTGSPVNPIATF
jgi:kynurenine formamidase